MQVWKANAICKQEMSQPKGEKYSPVVSHEATSVTGMEDPSERLREVVGRVDNAGNVTHDDVAGVVPILNSKMLDVNVTRAFGRYTSVDHLDGRHVVFVDGRGTDLWEPQFLQDRAKILRMFGCQDRSEKLSFSGAGGSDGLCLGAVGDSSSTQHESIAGSRAAVAEVVGVSGVDEAQ